MKPYELSKQEREDIIKYILDVRHKRYQALLKRYPGYELNFRNRYDIESNSVVPFFDILCESLLHKDGCGYLEPEEFTYQANCFAKTIFHRKAYSEWLNIDDPFLAFVWQDWVDTQPNGEFTRLEKHATALMSASDDLFEYHYRFIYSDKHSWMTVEDTCDLFDELVRVGVFLGKADGLYQVYKEAEVTDADTNIKHNYHAGNISKMDELHLRSTFNAKTLPALEQVNAKFNFIPMNGLGKFEGLWSQHKFGKHVWFIPQFLLFYGKKCIM